MRDYIAAVQKNILFQSVILYSSVAGISMIYLILACVDLSVPGANYDEMLYQAPAVNFLIASVHTEAMQINPSVIHIACYSYFLFSVNQPGVSGSEENLKNESVKLGFLVEPEKTFYQKNGEIIYKLYTKKPIQQNNAQ